MLGLILKEIFLPLAVNTVVKYIDSSSTKKDDEVLKVVQKGARYLVDNTNNTLEKDLKVDDISKCKMKKIQG